MSEVSCVAITIAKPGNEERVARELEKLIGPVHRETGVLQYEMHRDLDNPRRFVFIERWKDRASFDAHCNAPHVVEYIRSVEGLLEHAEFYPLKKVA
jgi:quinol monooxygenase YgiN